MKQLTPSTEVPPDKKGLTDWLHKEVFPRLEAYTGRVVIGISLTAISVDEQSRAYTTAISMTAACGCEGAAAIGDMLIVAMDQIVQQYHRDKLNPEPLTTEEINDMWRKFSKEKEDKK